MGFKEFFKKTGKSTRLTSGLCALALAFSVFVPAGNAFAAVSFTKDVPVIKTAPTGKQAAPAGIKVEELKSYKIAELKALPSKDLVATLETIKWYQIPDLFSGSEDAVAFFNDNERMMAIVTAIETKGQSFTATDDKGLPTLMEVFRAGLYLEFKNAKVTVLKNDALKNAFLKASMAVQGNSAFSLGTKEQDAVVSALGLMLWDGNVNAEIVNNSSKIIKQYRENMKTFAGDKGKEDAVFNTLRGVEFELGMSAAKGLASKHPAYKKIDGFNKEVAALALAIGYDKQTIWAPKNALFVLPTLGKFDSEASNSLKALTEAMKAHPFLEEVYLYAAKTIVERYGAIDYNGKVVDIAHIKELAIDKYMPKTYTFDNGKFVIHAGDKISAEKINRLYWAANEVSAQFFRFYGHDKALEMNHEDDVLTIYLYNSPEEYKMNFHLNDIDPNNGGMYIEEEGVFYTYERTPQESRYTIEELFRHEYTHFLQARYAEKGFWWQTPLYADERLTWYDEAGAEMFAGSTRTNGVVQRKTMVQYLVDDKANMFTLDQTLHGAYANGSAFYKYAYAFASFLKETDKATFDRLNAIIMADDVVAYDKLIKELSADKALDAKFKAYMENLIANVDKFGLPLVADDYVAKHSAMDSTSIKTTVAKSLDLKNVTMEEKASNTFNTFTLRGKFTGPKSEGKAKDWYTMDKIANEALIGLAKQPWSGYKTLTCYFVNHGVNKAGQMEYEVVFRGFLPAKAKQQAPVVKIQAPSTANVDTVVNFNRKGSFDPDGSIKSFAWNFGDGSKSNVANPTHTFKKSGQYAVTLTATDMSGMVSKSTVKVNVVKPLAGNKVFANALTENEPNDDVKSAQVIKLGETVKANMDMNDYTDVYSFEVKKSGVVNISVDNYQDYGIYWLLYSDKDAAQHIRFPNDIGKKLDGSVNLKPGKYHVRVYKYSNSYGYYNLVVNQK